MVCDAGAHSSADFIAVYGLFAYFRPDNHSEARRRRPRFSVFNRYKRSKDSSSPCEKRVNVGLFPQTIFFREHSGIIAGGIEVYEKDPYRVFLTARRLRPLARRLWMTFLPFFERIRFLNPCTRTLWRFFG